MDNNRLKTSFAIPTLGRWRIGRETNFCTVGQRSLQSHRIIHRYAERRGIRRRIDDFLRRHAPAMRRSAMPYDDLFPPQPAESPRPALVSIRAPQPTETSAQANTNTSETGRPSVPHSAIPVVPESVDRSSRPAAFGSRASLSRTIQPMLERTVASSSFHFLDDRLRARLGKMLRVNIPRLRVYTGSQADAGASAAGADAIAFQNDLFFRAGAYQPTTPAGIGLIAHEISHVLNNPVTSSPHLPPMSDDVIEQEEQQALRVEREVRSVVSRDTPSPLTSDVPSLPSPVAPVPRATPSSASPGPHHAMIKTASHTRDLEGPSHPQSAATSASASMLSAEQIRHLKEELYNDIRDRIRTDFERGA